MAKKKAKSSKGQKSVRSVVIPDSVWSQYDQLGAKTELTASALVRRALKHWLKSEDRLDLEGLFE